MVLFVGLGGTRNFLLFIQEICLLFYCGSMASIGFYFSYSLYALSCFCHDLSWFVICFNIISCIVCMLWNYLSYWQLHPVSLEILYFVTCVLYHKTSSCRFCPVYFVSQKTILIVWSVLFYKESACCFARWFYILRKVSANLFCTFFVTRNMCAI